MRTIIFKYLFIITIRNNKRIVQFFIKTPKIILILTNQTIQYIVYVECYTYLKKIKKEFPKEQFNNQLIIYLKVKVSKLLEVKTFFKITNFFIVIKKFNSKQTKQQ